MELSKVLSMKGGVGETSYAHNSLIQSATLSNTEHIKKEAIRKMYQSFAESPCLCIADLGCSSGPNALLAVSQLIAAIDDIRSESDHRQSRPDILVLLNDLPDNDWNTLLGSLPCFRKQEDLDTETGRCFVNGVPGSFYGPLFPRESVHFVHSSYSLHWLSRAPENLGRSSKGNLSLSDDSKESVLEAYFEQFIADFSRFLECRSNEMISGGCMVFTLMGRKSDDQYSSAYLGWNLLSLALRQMISEGLIEEEKLDLFNLPFYKPSEREIRNELEKQGWFSIDSVEGLEKGFDYAEARNEGEELCMGNMGVVGAVGALRAVAEPLLSVVFGGELMDGLFRRYGDILQHRVSSKQGHAQHYDITVSLTKL